MPKLLAKYRQHDPHRLLGVGITLNTLVNILNNRLESDTWVPYEDPNWIYVIGGYGRLGVLNNPDINPNLTDWPEDSNNPEWLPVDQEFNIEKLRRLSGHALHSQEGPGLWNHLRETPIPQPQRTWLTELYNLYNTNTNGFGFHAWPPTWTDDMVDEKGPMFDETDFFNVTREALKGNLVAPEYPVMVSNVEASSLKAYTYNGVLRMEGLSPGESVEIYSLTGSIIHREQPKGESFEIDLPSGFYLLKAGTRTCKAVVL
jgi:hypothetical protein